AQRAAPAQVRRGLRELAARVARYRLHRHPAAARLRFGPQPIVAGTAGGAAGIGPELCAHLALRDWGVHPVVLGDAGLIESRLGPLDRKLRVREWQPGSVGEAGTLDVLHLPLARACHPGRVDAANAAHVLAMLDRATDGCMSGEFAAMVTAPVHKAVINEAGIAFSGHTEYLAERTGTPRVVMMLVGGGLRVALVTTHLPLSAVPAAITPAVLEDTLRILHRDLRARF